MKTRTISLIVLVLLLGNFATGVSAVPAIKHITEASRESTSLLPAGTVVTPAQAVSDLDRPPAEADAVLVDPNNPGWITRYGSEAGRHFLPPRQPTFEAMPQGPAVTLGTWLTMTLQSGTADITAIVSAPDGRLFAGITGDGLRIYAPDTSGNYGWSAVHASLSGLASESVSALAVFGNELWVGTAGAGISIMTLSTGAWRTVNTGNSPLPGNDIVRITVVDPPSGPDYVWVSTTAGAARYKFTLYVYTWLILTTADGLPSNALRDITVQFLGNTTYTWFSTDLGLARWDGTNWTMINGGGDCTFDRATLIIVDHNNTIWLGAEKFAPAIAEGAESAPAGGYYYFNGVCHEVITLAGPSWTLYNGFIPGLPFGALTDMSVDRAGRIWMGFWVPGGGGGAAVYDQGSWGIYEKPATPLYAAEINAVHAVGEAVWFGHGGAPAFSVFSPNWRRYTAADMLGSGTPGALLVEPSTTWVGLGSGIAWRGSTSWSHRDIPGNAAAVTAFARDGAGTFWIGTAGNGLFTFDGNNTFAHQTAADGLPSNDVRALLTDHEGRLWVATAGGLALRANGYWLAFTQATSFLSSDDLLALALDATDRIWIGTSAYGIDIYDPNANGKNAWSTQTTANGLPSDVINGLATEPGGAIWAATATGLGRWDPTTSLWTVYNQSGGALPNNNALSVASDPVGRIWVGASGGLAQHEAADWQRLHVPGSMLGSDRVRAVASDGTRLWTSAGAIVSARGVITSPIGNFPPVVSSFIPPQGTPLSTMTITGNHFDERGPAFNEVHFCCLSGQPSMFGPQAMVISATQTTLAVKVPSLANSGKLMVKAHGLTALSADEFQVAPSITGLSATCLGLGDKLVIQGMGFAGVQSAAVYVKLGNGPERQADMQDPTQITQYIRPGDTSGPVRVRLLNNLQSLSSQSLTIATLTVDKVRIQQGVEGEPLIWGKRTLVQLALKSGGCASTITAGHLEWRKKDGTTATAAWPEFPAAGLKVGGPCSFCLGTLNDSANFVAEFNSGRSGYNPQFPLSQFDGVRITLNGAPNGWMALLTIDVPASAMPYTEIGDRRHFYTVPVVPVGYTAAQYENFWNNAMEGLKHIARVYPQQDTAPYPDRPAWLNHVTYWGMEFDEPTVDLSEGQNDFDQIQGDVEDYLDNANDRRCDGGDANTPCRPYLDQAMGLVAKELYAGGPSGKATVDCGGSLDCDQEIGVSFNRTGWMAPIFLQESIHALSWVAPGSPNKSSTNGHHSKYDENQTTATCATNLTFRQALLDQLGSATRVVRLDDGSPQEFLLIGCDPKFQAKSAMSYAPKQQDGNAFLEPLDYQHVLDALLNGTTAANATSGPLPIVPISPSPSAANFSRSLRLNGSIDTSDQVSVTMSYLLGIEGTPSAPATSARYHLQLRAATAALLLDHPFGLTFSSAVGGPLARAGFHLRVPFPDGAVMAELRDGDQLIWTKAVSANTPVVALTGPSGGSFNAASVVPVTWTASDADGDPLQFALDYSPDDGKTWMPVTPKLKGTSFNWLPGFVPPSNTARLRLRASDGFNTAAAVSAPFALSARAPFAFISGPQDGDVFAEGATITLRGGSLTADGIGAGTFLWTRGAAQIGTSRDISYTLDRVGTYFFNLQVTANGLSASKAVSVTVVPDYDHDGMPNAWELQHKLNPLDSTDTNDDPDGDGLSNLVEYQLGTDPRNPDSDGDGFNDGAEVAAGTDPLDPAQKPATAAVLNVGAQTLGFTTHLGDPAPAPWKIWVTNGGPGSLSWTASTDAAWLSVSPGQGGTPAPLTISTAPDGLPVGTHTAYLAVNSPGAAGSPHIITVILVVLPRAFYRLYLPLIRKNN